jgi:hypothetical protein
MSTTPPVTPPPATPAAPVAKESFWQKVVHVFDDVKAFVSSAFVKIFGSAAAKQFAAGAVAILKTSLGQIAMTAVQQAAGLENNTAKFSTAFDTITKEAEAQGIAAGDSLKNMLIELAVQQLKLNFGPADQAPTS